MASFTITVSGLAKQWQDLGLVQTNPKQAAYNALSALWGGNLGALSNSSPSINVATSLNDAVAAWGTLTISSGSGSVGGTICGTAKTVTWATTDAASAAALAAAINADATLKQLVVATSAAGVVTIAALVPGLSGNQFTLVASGTGVTAGHLSGGKFSGGTGADTQGPAGNL